MKKRSFIVFLIVAVLGTMIAGCGGNKTNSTSADVNPIVEKEEEEAAIDEQDMDESEVVEEDILTEETEIAEEAEDTIDDSIMYEPLPDDREELLNIIYSITDPQLIQDYWDKISIEGKHHGVSGEDFIEMILTYREELEKTNPELYEAYLNTDKDNWKNYDYQYEGLRYDD